MKLSEAGTQPKKLYATSCKGIYVRGDLSKGQVDKAAMGSDWGLFDLVVRDKDGNKIEDIQTEEQYNDANKFKLAEIHNAVNEVLITGKESLSQPESN